MLRVHSIETFGTHEGPGIRLVIFLQGCNFRCVYCHNPDTQPMAGGREMQTDDILKLLEKEKLYFKDKGGLTISGGEPLIQRQRLIELFTQVKKAGFHITLDTNGSILDDYTKKLMKVTDLVLLDMKHIDPVWHQKVTKASNVAVLQFAKYLEEIQKPIWLRYVLVPGYTDKEEFLHKWGQHFKSFKNIERVEILPYHMFGEFKYEELGWDYPLKGVKPPSAEEVREAEDIFKRYFQEVYIR